MTQAYSKGHADGLEHGYVAGKQQGFEEGYKLGKKHGIDEVKQAAMRAINKG